MSRSTHPMRASLRFAPEPPLPPGLVVRALTPGDETVLGTLMVSAYAGTFDDDGQPPEFHASEAQRTVAGEYGAVEWDASLMATAGEQPVGATVVTHDRGRLLLAFALVAPERRNRGVGTALVVRSANRLHDAGATEWTLAVTAGNPAQRLYERLGFVVDPRLR